MAAGSSIGKVYLFSKETQGENVAQPQTEDNFPHENENVNPSSLEVTLTFTKSDGTPLANTTIYYGTSPGQETTELGTTDSQGKITSTNPFSGQTLFLKSSDGRYIGSYNGGTTSLSLTEVPGFPIWVIVVLIGCGVAVGLVLFLKRRGGSGGWRTEKESGSADIPAIRMRQARRSPT
jgi:hypothetical protein